MATSEVWQLTPKVFGMCKGLAAAVRTHFVEVRRADNTPFITHPDNSSIACYSIVQPHEEYNDHIGIYSGFYRMVCTIPETLWQTPYCDTYPDPTSQALNQILNPEA